MDRVGTPVERAALVLCGLLLGCAFVQQPSVMDPSNIDDSWLYALTHAAVHGLRFGDDLVFNYGPLGWLHYPFAHPALLDRELAASLALSAVFVAIALGTARSLRSGPAALFFLAWLGISASYLRGLAFHLAPLLMTVLALRRLPRVSAWLPAAVVFCGLGSLVKLTVVAFAIPCVVALAWTAWRQGLRRVAAACALGYPLTWALGWLALGQSPAGFARYHRLGLELVLGHADGMAYTDGAPPTAALALVGVTLGLAALAARGGIPRPAGPPLFVAAAATVFLEWKQAYVRADMHRLELFALLPLLAVALPAPRAGESAARWVRALRVGAVALGAYGMSAVLPLTGTWDQMVGAWPQRARFVTHWLLEPEVLRREVIAERQEVSDREALPRARARVGRSAVDLVPSVPGILFANDLTWHPRPCFDGRLAYTAALYDANYDHLTSRRAPPFLLVRRSTDDDGLLPSSIGAASIRAALERYRPLFEERDVVLAARRARPLQLGLAGPGDVRRIAFGEDVAIDAGPDDLVWMTLRIRRSPLGALRSLAVRPREVHLHVAAGAETRRYRVAVGMVERPVLLSPLLGSADNVMFLARTEPGLPAVQRIRVETDDPMDFADEVELTLFRVPGGRARLRVAWEEGAQVAAPAQPGGPGRCDGDEVRFAGDDAIDVPIDGPARLTLSFGICGEEHEIDGEPLAELEVALDRGGEEVPIARAGLRPGQELAPRELRASLPGEGPATVRLRAWVDPPLRGLVYWRPPAVEPGEAHDPARGAAPDAIVSRFEHGPVRCGDVDGVSLHAPADAVFMRAPGVYRVRGLVGVCRGNASGGLGFAVGARGAGGLRVAWGRAFRPAEAQAAPRIAFDTTVTLEAGEALVVRSDPDGSPNGDWGWLGAVQIEPVHVAPVDMAPVDMAPVDAPR